MSSNKTLKVHVIAGRNLSGKNNGKSDPFCEIILLDNQGNKIGKPKFSKVIKGDLNPQWKEILEFQTDSSFTGLKLRCWDKHKFRSDKFLGQITIKFNTSLLSSTEKLDDWFVMNKRKEGEDVTGDIHLQIVYGELKQSEIIKERGGTVSHNENENIKVSANFSSQETNNKLKLFTHVVVDEDPDETKGNFDGYEKIREGPSDSSLDKLIKEEKDLIFSNKNLEVTNNSSDYYSISFAKGNTLVNGGKWYYEVRIIVSGNLQVGWCSEKYDPKSQNGQCWIYDSNKQKKLRNGIETSFGEYANNGDIIGVGLDIENKLIQYWKNGKDLGIAFNDVFLNGIRLAPIIGLSRKVRCLVNFGKENFAFPQASFNMLHCFLSNKEIDQLSKLFLKYKDIGNKISEIEKQENKGENIQEFEQKDSIYGSGLIAFTSDLGVQDDEDPLLMIIAWKLKCETLWEISHEEFMNGFTIAGCSTIEKIKSKTKEWRNELKQDLNFRAWYNFVFDYLKEDKKVLITEEAIMAWKIVLKERPWPLLDDFVEFLTKEEKKSVSRDGWQQLWHFMAAYPKTLKEYDSSASWPIIYDEFVDWMEANGRKNKRV